MAIKANGVDINQVYFNQTEKTEVYMNGTQVLSGEPAGPWFDLKLTVADNVSDVYNNFTWDGGLKIQKNDGTIYEWDDNGNSGKDLFSCSTGDILRIGFSTSTIFKCTGDSTQTHMYGEVEITNTRNLTTLADAFLNQYNMLIANISNASSVQDWSNTFKGCSKLNTITLNDINPTSMTATFNNCSLLSDLDITGSTSNVTNFSSTFSQCKKLLIIPEIIDTSSATDTNSMFFYCQALLWVPKLDLSKSLNCYAMYYHCDNLAFISDVNCSSATDTSYMFRYCGKLVNLVSIDTSASTSDNSGNMFQYCDLLISPNSNDISDIEGGTNWRGCDMIVDSNVADDLYVNVNGTIEYDTTGTSGTFTSLTSDGTVQERLDTSVGTSDYIRIKFTDTQTFKFANRANTGDCVGKVWTDLSKIKSNDASEMFGETSKMTDLSVFYSKNITNWNSFLLSTTSLQYIYDIDTRGATDTTDMFIGTDGTMTRPNADEKTAIENGAKFTYRA